MTRPVHEEQYKTYAIEIWRDEDPQNPREWDNLGTMLCWHRHYELGDKSYVGDCSTESPHLSIERAKLHMQRVEKTGVVLPLYLYDHSGLSMSTSNEHYPFNCPWDSGQVGWIYCEAKTIRENWQIPRVTAQKKQQTRGILQGEVDEYNAYLRGEVYGYKIFDACTQEERESCWGYYDLQYCIDYAKASIDALRRTEGAS